MSDKVRFILSCPEKIVKEGDYWGIVLPTAQDNLTIIAGRAPSLVYLNSGVIKLMNTPDAVREKFYISEGVAEIANNLCRVSSEYVLNSSEVNMEEVQNKLESSISNYEKNFYQAVYDDFIAFKDK